MQAGIVRLDMVTRALLQYIKPVIQFRVAGGLNCGPVQARYGGKPDIFGDHTLRNAQRIGNLLVRQLGVQLQTQYVFYLTHSDPWYGHAVSRQKTGSVRVRLLYA